MTPLRLQRPVVSWLLWYGHAWPVVLRVKPRSRKRIAVRGPSNDNAWSVRDEGGGRYIGGVLKTWRMMHELHEHAVARRGGVA